MNIHRPAAVVMAILIAAATAATADAQGIRPRPTPPLPALVQKLPPCTQGDSAGPCRWDATHQGNGVGSSSAHFPLGKMLYTGRGKARRGWQACIVVAFDGTPPTVAGSCTPGV